MIRVNPILLTVLAYAIGATPTSFWVAKAGYGVDLRTKGSGNLGSTNTFRVLGWKAALPVMVIDVFKGWLPTWYFPLIQSEAAPWTWALAYGGAAIFGHVFSFWVGFKGGKGVATSAGLFLAVAPWAVLGSLVVWLVVVCLTGTPSLGSLSAVLALLPLLYVLPHEGGPPVLWFTMALATFVFWAHRSNIQRLLRGEESSLRQGSEDPT